MSWEEVEEYLKRDDRIILPLGSLEEHGRHLGLGTDSLEAEAIAVGSGETTGVVVAPTLNYGMAMAQMSFPGTVSLMPTTLIAIVEDLLRALYNQGYRRVLIVNGHGGNTAPIVCAVQAVAADLPDLKVKKFEWWTDPEAYQVVREMLGEQDGSHACESETSFMMAICPEGVKLERLTGKSSPIPATHEMTTINNFRTIYPDGIMGYHPVKSNAEAGRALLQKSVEICVRELADWEVDLLEGVQASPT
jgi:creatinine amidohydrolase